MAETATCLDLFLRHARAAPHAPAAEQETGTLSYAGLLEAAQLRARKLAGQGGRPGSRVAVEAEHGADYATSLLAVWLIQGVAVPLDPAAPAQRRRFQVLQAQCEAAVTGPAADGVTQSAVAEAAAGPGRRGEPEVSVPAYVMFTSGSTGRPKGVVADHAALVNVLGYFVRSMHLRPGDRTLAHSNPVFDMSLFETLIPLISGGCIAAAPRRARHDPEAFAAWLRARPVDVAPATPSELQQLHPFLKGRPGFGTLISGGEALTAALAQDLTAVAGKLWNGYGPTESTVAAMATPLTQPFADPMPIGHPIPGLVAHVLDGDLQPVGEGEAGELYLSGIGLARGYAGDPEQTARAFITRPGGTRMYRTFDLVRVQADGRFVFCGRTDDQVKIRGHRVEIGEIEAAARRAPLVASAAALLSDAGRSSTDLYLAVAAKPGARPDPSVLRDHLRQLLPSYMQPYGVLFFADLPRNASGKIDRHEVRRQVEERLRAQTQAVTRPLSGKEANA